MRGEESAGAQGGQGRLDRLARCIEKKWKKRGRGEYKGNLNPGHMPLHSCYEDWDHIQSSQPFVNFVYFLFESCLVEYSD